MKRKVEPLGGRDENLCGWLDGNTSWEWTIFLWVWLTIDKKTKTKPWLTRSMRASSAWEVSTPYGISRRKGANWWIHTITQKHKTMDKWN